MAWQENSIMASKGVAKGKPGIHHMITEADQGKYHYVYGPYVKPVLTVDPGAVVSAETHDAFEGAIKYETDIPSKILNFPFLNPQNGPIWINGAEKGDTYREHRAAGVVTPKVHEILVKIELTSLLPSPRKVGLMQRGLGMTYGVVPQHRSSSQNRDR